MPPSLDSLLGAYASHPSSQGQVHCPPRGRRIHSASSTFQGPRSKKLQFSPIWTSWGLDPGPWILERCVVTGLVETIWLFVRDAESVRVIRAATPEGRSRLLVYGPGNQHATHDFDAGGA